jgi:hypothetical protein
VDGPSGTGHDGAMWWRLRELDGGAIEVTLGGDLDENASFEALAPRLRGRVHFDLSGVRRVNSCGVREWVTFHRDLVPASVSQLELRACSPAVVAQLSTISNFRGRARVASFLAPFACDDCNLEEHCLVEVADDPIATRLPSPACPRCGRAMAFDDLPDRYLSFLREA